MTTFAEHLRNVADRPTAVYRFYAADDRLLYVGITFSLGLRFAQHERGSDWWAHQQSVKVVWRDNRALAADEERAAIRNEKPIHNKAGTPPAMCLAWERGECGCSRHCLGDPRRGPIDHPAWTPGEGLTPGLDTGFADRTTEATGPVVGQPVAGSSHLAASSVAASGDGRTSGHAEAAASRQDVGESPEPTTPTVQLGADANSGPRPSAHTGPDGPRCEAGTGFTLPAAKRWTSC